MYSYESGGPNISTCITMKFLPINFHKSYLISKNRIRMEIKKKKRIKIKYEHFNKFISFFNTIHQNLVYFLYICL